MIRCLVREVVVKLPMVLAVMLLIAGCAPVHFGIEEYRASRQGGGDLEAAAPQAEQDNATHPLVPHAVNSKFGPTIGHSATPEPAATSETEPVEDASSTSGAVSQLQGLEGVVAVRQINAETLRLGAWVSFNEEFRQGQVPAGSHLVAQLGERQVPVEMDVRSRYPDGSIRSGTITTAAGDVTEIILLRR